MKAKLYIVTYNQQDELNNWCLKSLFESDFPIDNNVFIISNHSNCEINDDYKNRVTLLDNVLRSDDSNGHLGQNWNQAIILGFKNLLEPDCDLVIAVQVDTKFKKDWFSLACRLVNDYDYICQGGGDQIQVFTANHIRKTGLYDETIANIAWHENEYFARCVIYNCEKTSITDWAHDRKVNPLDQYLIEHTITGANRNTYYTPKIREFQDLGEKITTLKYDKPINWNNLEHIKTLKIIVPVYMYYPFFEKNIENLKEKGYII